MIRVKLTSDDGPGRRFGDVIDQDGDVIGSAHDYPYGGRGFAVHTVPFAGFVACEEIEFVEMTETDIDNQRDSQPECHTPPQDDEPGSATSRGWDRAFGLDAVQPLQPAPENSEKP